MRQFYHSLIIVVIVGDFLTAQTTTTNKGNSGKVPAASELRSFGIGFRLGDPSGVTLKKYLGANALELNIGRSRWMNGRDHYDRDFDKWYYENNFGYKDFQYIGYRRGFPLGVQLHYLWQKPLGNSGFYWYIGFGGQMRFQKYYYDYRYKVEGDNEWRYTAGDALTDIDLGADGVIGLEFIFPKAPFALFLDGTLFMEIVDDPFIFWPQGGFGARYNFGTTR